MLEGGGDTWYGDMSVVRLIENHFFDCVGVFMETNEEKYNRRMTEIHSLGTDGGSMGNAGEPIDVRYEELKALFDAFLGEEYDPVKFAQVEASQIAMHKEHQALTERYMGNKMDIEEFSVLVQALFEWYAVSVDTIVGRENFLKLFGRLPKELCQLFMEEKLA